MEPVTPDVNFLHLLSKIYQNSSFYIECELLGEGKKVVGFFIQSIDGTGRAVCLQLFWFLIAGFYSIFTSPVHDPIPCFSVQEHCSDLLISLILSTGLATISFLESFYFTLAFTKTSLKVLNSTGMFVFSS